MNTKNNIKLSRNDVRRSAMINLHFHHSAQNYERMMGLAFTHALQKPLRKLYTNDQDYIESLQRHMMYYNTEPTMGAVVPGVILALEEGKANGLDITEELIVNTKTSLMGPLAGVGDSLIGSVYQSIVASIAIGMSIESGSLLGPVFFLLFHAGILVAIKYGLFMKGYDLGIKVLDYLTGEITEMLTLALSVVGLVTVGGIAANTVKVPVALEYVNGDLVISIQEILDKIMPNFLPLLLTIGIWYLYSKKGWTVVKALLAIVVVTFLLVLIGVL